MSKQKTPDKEIEKALYSVNEQVLCFHGPLIYEAKVLKISYREREVEKSKSKDKASDKKEKVEGKEIHYWVHYNGWSKKWDEWVPESRVLRFTQENKLRQDELATVVQEKTPNAKKVNLKAVATKKKSTGGDSSSVNLSVNDSRSSTPVSEVMKGTKKPNDWKNVEEDGVKKKKRSEFVEPEHHFELKAEVNIPLTEKLKLFLVDDWDFVTRQKRLVNIPARHTVESILNDYLKYVKEHDEAQEANAKDLVTGIKEYFDVMLSNQLMYRYERQQYLELEKDPEFQAKLKSDGEELKPSSSIYGASHLLRLLTRIGGCMTYTVLEAEDIDLLCKCMDKFIKFLDLNFKEYFSVDDYGAAPPEYQRKGKRQFPAIEGDPLLALPPAQTEATA